MSITENMGKKSLVALMAVSALVPVMSVEVSASSPNAEGDFEFEDGVIKKYTGDSKEVVIPSEIGGVKVTGIGSGAFLLKGLTTVGIPNTVLEIGSNAFSYNNLTELVIPNSVTVIESNAFSNNKITTVDIPNTVLEIGSNAFSHNNLTKLVIPNSVTDIDSFAFESNNLTTIDIPKSVAKLGINPFSKNPNLETINISSENLNYFSTEGRNAIYTMDGKTLITGTTFMANNMLDTITKIGQESFEGLGLTTIVIPNKVEVIGSFAFNRNDIATLELPDTITTIEQGAFQENRLSKIDIPTSVNYISYAAFGGNPLEKVTIPKTVTKIAYSAFEPSPERTGGKVPIDGYENSEAERFAKENNHPFNALPEPNENSQDATLNLFGGTLSLDAPLFESFGTHELQSEVQTVTSSFEDSFKVYDARGTGEGWRLDVTSTQMELVEPEDGFKEGTSTHVLPVGTLSLDPLESIEPFNDSKGILPSPILDVTSIIDDGAVTIAKADIGEGMGAFELTFGEGAFSATIDPSTAKIDKINYPDSDTPYEATVTWTLVSAP